MYDFFIINELNFQIITSKEEKVVFENNKKISIEIVETSVKWYKVFVNNKYFDTFKDIDVMFEKLKYL